MKVFTLAICLALISCVSTEVKQTGKEDTVNASKDIFEIHSIRALPDDMGYRVFIKYFLDSFDPINNKYVCSYKQLYDGKWSIVNQNWNCKIETSEGSIFFDWKPETKYKKLNIVRVVKDGSYVTPPYEILDVDPPFEVQVLLMRTPNKEACWKTSNKSGKRYWGCGYGPLAESSPAKVGE
ncbi:hypothetical protein [Microbulbifer sp. THAF38]|uniref:hypothetical protein n=1 Tax=Microbulbifer sp. THAF38 TaxID=2587856 RepID=UPI0012683E7E|nr:hypothetical protein [Microbulbifer sp. THAF38]QFT54363.1 hypothetical protein FIU95_07300 [Microbulbifer sp. THAF38]